MRKADMLERYRGAWMVSKHQNKQGMFEVFEYKPSFSDKKLVSCVGRFRVFLGSMEEVEEWCKRMEQQEEI